MKFEDFLKNINFDKYYQVGTLMGFILLLTSLMIEIKVLNNFIVMLYSLSICLLFFGIWLSMSKKSGVGGSEGIPLKYEIEKYNNKIIMGIITRWASLIIFIAAIIQTIKFFT